MKNALLMAAVSILVFGSGSALASETSPNGGMSTSASCAQASNSQTALAQLVRRPSPSDCYIECAPERSDGDYSRCYNECMRRR